MLHNLARGLTDSPQDAEDLVQETCLLGLPAGAVGRPTTRSPGWPRCA
jgi:DNA-directed RNA polymerase specialized sigma24 family protein